MSAATIIPNYLPCINTDKKVIEDGETHKVILTYQVDPDRMVYGTYSTGFRPGGNNRLAGVAPYAADTLTNLEVGWKTAWFEHTLRVNGALFFERWRNVQLGVTGQSGITTIVNAADAQVKGLESDVSWLALESLELRASGSYANARTTQNFCELNLETQQITHDCPVPTAPAGTPLPVTPRFKVNGTARYKFDFDGYASYLQGTVLHQASSTSQLNLAENDEMGNLPHFTTVDFAAGTGLGNWHVDAYIENAFGKQGELNRTAECASANCFINYRVYPVKPMNFGVKFGQKF